MKASWRAVAQPPMLVAVGVAGLLSLATVPYLNGGNQHQVRVGVAILLACALAATAEDPAPEVAAASPYPRWVRCGTRLLLGLALALPVAILSLVLIEQRIAEMPTGVAVAQMLGLLMAGPAIGFGMSTWGRVAQPTYAAMIGVVCFSFALWLLPLAWSVIKVQAWASSPDSFVLRCLALALLGCAVVAAAWRDPAKPGGPGMPHRPLAGIETRSPSRGVKAIETQHRAGPAWD